MLTKDQILASNDVISSIESVFIPQWKGEVFVRVMTGQERSRFERSNDTAPKETIRGRLCAASICNHAGDLLFTESEVEALGKLSSVALDLVMEVAMRVNGIGPTSVAAEAKNS